MIDLIQFTDMVFYILHGHCNGVAWNQGSQVTDEADTGRVGINNEWGEFIEGSFYGKQ